VVCPNWIAPHCHSAQGCFQGKSEEDLHESYSYWDRFDGSAALNQPASAQMDDRPILSVSVPFAFTVENTRMPAGEYIVSVIYPDHLWKLSTLDHKANVLLRVSPDYGNGKLSDTQLIFLHYPTDYVLSQISDRDMDVVATVYAGKRARQLPVPARQNWQ
jgi:hypothetical protein